MDGNDFNKEKKIKIKRYEKGERRNKRLSGR
jgi:hypothetical protein